MTQPESVPIAQQIERRYIQFALGRAGIDTSGLSFSDDRAVVPDARLHLDDGRVVGVEQTQIRIPGARGVKMSAREARLRQVMDSAEQFYRERHPCPRPLHVIADFDDDLMVRPQEVSELASEIADLVCKYEGMADPDVFLDQLALYRLGWPMGKPLHFDHLNIDYFPNVTASCWGPAFGCAVVPLIPQVLQAFIDRKDQSFNRYVKGLDEVWLILTMECGSPSTCMDLDALSSEHVFETKFSRVFLDQIVGAKCHELRIATPEPRRLNA